MLSPREIVTGKKFCVPHHEIGDYVQAHTLCKNDNGATIQQTVDALYLGSSDDNDEHDMFTLLDENQQDSLEFTGLLSDINTHSNIINVNWDINTNNTLGSANTFYNTPKDSDSDTGNSEVDSDCDTEDLEVDGPGPVIENPEVHEVSNHVPEEMGEVPEKKWRIV